MCYIDPLDEEVEGSVTVEDPTTWTSPWTAALPMPKVEEQMYEYACHEDNYGLAGQLRGARVQGKAATEAAEPR